MALCNVTYLKDTLNNVTVADLFIYTTTCYSVSIFNVTWLIDLPILR